MWAAAVAWIRAEGGAVGAVTCGTASTASTATTTSTSITLGETEDAAAPRGIIATSALGPEDVVFRVPWHCCVTPTVVRASAVGCATLAAVARADEAAVAAEAAAAVEQHAESAGSAEKARRASEGTDEEEDAAAPPPTPPPSSASSASPASPPSAVRWATPLAEYRFIPPRPAAATAVPGSGRFANTAADLALAMHVANDLRWCCRLSESEGKTGDGGEDEGEGEGEGEGGPRPFHAPYYATLPPSREFDSLPRRWPEAVIRRSLQGSPLVDRIVAQKRGLLRDYAAIVEFWPQSNGGPSNGQRDGPSGNEGEDGNGGNGGNDSNDSNDSNSSTTSNTTGTTSNTTCTTGNPPAVPRYADFDWAMALISSRAFVFDVVGGAHGGGESGEEGGEEEGENEGAEEGGGAGRFGAGKTHSVECLVPMLDLLNHKRPRETAYRRHTSAEDVTGAASGSGLAESEAGGGGARDRGGASIVLRVLLPLEGGIEVHETYGAKVRSHSCFTACL